MLLSDGTIRKLLESGGLTINPMPTDERIQPASVDLTLGNHFRPALGPGVTTDDLWLPAGAFRLATTAEKVRLGGSVAGVVMGKSTYARAGLVVESAGFVDPGFEGSLTLELFNMGSSPFRLTAGMTIAQIRFEFLDFPAERPYGAPGLNSHYQHQTRATPARYGWRCQSRATGMQCPHPASPGLPYCERCAAA